MIKSEPRRPLPSDENELAGEYFASGTEAVRLQYCEPCARWIFYPRQVCPECLSGDAIEWRSISGRGVVSSYTRIHRSQHTYFDKAEPAWLLAVQIEEGPVLVVNATEDSETPKIGDTVVLVRVEVAAGVSLPLARIVNQS